jgi:hypothetical protein
MTGYRRRRRPGCSKQYVLTTRRTDRPASRSLFTRASRRSPPPRPLTEWSDRSPRQSLADVFKQQDEVQFVSRALLELWQEVQVELLCLGRLCVH